MELPQCQVWQFPHGAYPRFDYFIRNVKEYARRLENLLTKAWLDVSRRREIKELLTLLSGEITVVLVPATGIPIPLQKVVQSRDFLRGDKMPTCHYTHIGPESDFGNGEGATIFVYQFNDKLTAMDRFTLKAIHAHCNLDKSRRLIFSDMSRTTFNTSINKVAHARKRVKRRRRKFKRRTRRIGGPKTLQPPRVTTRKKVLTESVVQLRKSDQKTHDNERTNQFEGAASNLPELKEILARVFEGRLPTNPVMTDDENLSMTICLQLESMSVDVLKLIDNSLNLMTKSYEIPTETCLVNVLRDQIKQCTEQTLTSHRNLVGCSLELHAKTDWQTDEKQKMFHQSSSHRDNYDSCYVCGLLFRIQELTTHTTRNAIRHCLSFKHGTISQILTAEMALKDPMEEISGTVRELFEKDFGDKIPYRKQRTTVQRGFRSREIEVPNYYHRNIGVMLREKYPETVANAICHAVFHVRDMLRSFGAQIADNTANKVRATFLEMSKDTRKQWVKKVDRLHWEVSSLMSQARSPSPERSSEKDKTMAKIPDVVINKLLKSDKAILGFGYFFGTFRVHVEKDAFRHSREEIKSKVDDVLSCLELKDYELIPVAKEMDHFARPQVYGVGDKIKPSGSTGQSAGHSQQCNTGSMQSDSKGSGTLGGVVKCIETDGGSKKTVCALVSHHVVTGATEVSIYDEGKGRYVKIGRRIVPGEKEGMLDISAVEIDEGLTSKFYKRFKNSAGWHKPCKLFDFTDETSVKALTGRKVHIWGAQTKPGKGVIASPAYIIGVDVDDLDGGDSRVEPNAVAPHQKLVVIVDEEVDKDEEEEGEDVEEVAHRAVFSKPGDSGSTVVADDASDRVLVLSMLIGARHVDTRHKESQDTGHEYYTFRLVDGLHSLKNRTGKSFELFN